MLSIFADIGQAQDRNIITITYLGPTTYKTHWGPPGNLPVGHGPPGPEHTAELNFEQS